MTTPTPAEAADIVRAALIEVAPDVAEELDRVRPDADVFETLELDSMDHLNVMVAISHRTGHEIAERDYGRLRSIEALAGFLASDAAG